MGFPQLEPAWNLEDGMLEDVLPKKNDGKGHRFTFGANSARWYPLVNIQKAMENG